MRITEVDRAWGREMKHYMRNEDEALPPIDRFNLGQKYFFWVMLCAALVLLVTGAAMWFPLSLPLAMRGVMVLIHVSAALVTIRAFLIHVHIGLPPALRGVMVLIPVSAGVVAVRAFILHVYMGPAMVRGGFNSIIRGE